MVLHARAVAVGVEENRAVRSDESRAHMVFAAERRADPRGFGELGLRPAADCVDDHCRYVRKRAAQVAFVYALEQRIRAYRYNCGYQCAHAENPDEYARVYL